MKISTKGRYALRLMLDLAQNSNDSFISLKDISTRQGISVKYLEQIVGNLCNLGLLKSSRGSQGGYMLVKTPEEYTIGSILRVTEGKLAPVACLDNDAEVDCTRAQDCMTLGFWQGLYKVINDYVDQFTLADLLKESEHSNIS
ncbi:MAG: Rrf2 family transcriptional regulator [Bacillota bacterium]|nr:Rrf2 family transcriptional regulator [Bacillota bacterium]